MKSILHLGAGKMNIKEFSCDGFDFVVHVDRSYEEMHSITEIETNYLKCAADPDGFRKSLYAYNGDIFEFLDTFRFKFDKIVANRVFEHMWYDSGQIGRLLDACNQITNDYATMEIIVPDFDKIIERYKKFKKDIDSCTYVSPANGLALLINSECTNTQVDAHGSVWSRSLAGYYVENEGGTWKINAFEDVPMYKGRDIYFKIFLTKLGEQKRISSLEG